MRIVQGAPFVTPERAALQKEEARKREEAPGAASSPRDRVQISQEARDLHAGRASDESLIDEQLRAPEHMREVRQRIDSGLAESNEVLREVAQKLLEVLGL
jgi:hypothetical protein